MRAWMEVTMGENDMPEPDGSDTAPPRRRGLLGRLVSGIAGFLAMLIVVACLVVIGVGIGGFFRFTSHVASLSPPAEVPESDAIVVLTGGYLRIETGLDLLEKGKGRKLLISGVNPDTSRDAIRRGTETTDRLFACCVELGRQARDTVGNAIETERWITENGFDRVILVTNNYHLPRSMLELRRVGKAAEIVPYPVVNTDLGNGEWITDPEIVRVLVTEYVKLVVAGAREWARPAL